MFIYCSIHIPWLSFQSVGTVPNIFFFVISFWFYLIHFVCFIFRFSNFLGNGVWGSFSFSLYKLKMFLILKNNLFLGFADLSLSFIVWPQVMNFDSVSHSLTASLHAFRSAWWRNGVGFLCVFFPIIHWFSHLGICC